MSQGEEAVGVGELLSEVEDAGDGLLFEIVLLSVQASTIGTLHIEHMGIGSTARLYDYE
jgi:hypothetical protein